MVADFKILLAEAALALLLNATANLIGRETSITVTKWGWFLFFMHATYLVACSSKNIVSVSAHFKNGVRKVTSYLVVVIIGTGLALFYWYGLTRTYAKLFPINLKLVFSESPLFTEARKTFVATEISGIRNYLVDVGFTVPENVPPIQFSEHGGMIASPSDYGYTIMLTARQLDDKLAVRAAYSNYAFMSMMGVSKTSLFEQANLWDAYQLFATYFTSSYSGTDFSRHDGWDQILWQLRNQTSQNVLDHALFYSVKLFEQVHGDAKGNFNVYFRNHIESGCLAIDNPGMLTWRPKLEKLIKDSGIKEASPSLTEEKK
jgi:hypothetical protein